VKETPLQRLVVDGDQAVAVQGAQLPMVLVPVAGRVCVMVPGQAVLDWVKVTPRQRLLVGGDQAVAVHGGGGGGGVAQMADMLVPTADLEEEGLDPGGVPAQPAGIRETVRLWVKVTPRQRDDVAGDQAPVDHLAQDRGGLVEHDAVVLVPVADREEPGRFPGGVPAQPEGASVTVRVWLNVAPEQTVDLAGDQAPVDQPVHVCGAHTLPA